MPDSDHSGRPVRYYEWCYQCNARTYVLLPEGATELDVLAEFSSEGREVGFDDHEGVVCWKCAEALHAA